MARRWGRGRRLASAASVNALLALAYAWQSRDGLVIHAPSVYDLEPLAPVARFALLVGLENPGAEPVALSAEPTLRVRSVGRGGELSVYDLDTRQCIKALRDRIDAKRATSVWESALQAKCDRIPVWIHGDVAPGNLLVDGGRLCAVIDFGQLAAGDPSCDVTIAWTLLTGYLRDRTVADLKKALRRKLELLAGAAAEAGG